MNFSQKSKVIPLKFLVATTVTFRVVLSVKTFLIQVVVLDISTHFWAQNLFSRVFCVLFVGCKWVSFPEIFVVRVGLKVFEVFAFSEENLSLGVSPTCVGFPKEL